MITLIIEIWYDRVLIKVPFLDTFFFSGHIIMAFVIDVLHDDNLNINMTDLAQLTENCLAETAWSVTSAGR